MNEIFLKKTDVLPVIDTTLSNAGGAIDLTDATGVYFVYQPRWSGAATSNQATFVSKPNGQVRYSWTGTDVANIGPYWYEWRVYFSGQAQRTFPSGGYGTFEIISGLV